MGHCDDIIQASMIATKLHFNLQLHQSKSGYGRERPVARKIARSKGNNTAVVNIIQMSRKRDTRVIGKK